MRPHTVGCVALVTGLLTLAPTPALASCAEEAGPAGADVIFVGTPVEQRRGYTRLEVEEVWAGPDLAPEVWVLSGQAQPPWPFYLFSSVSSSIDAELADGETYVVGATDEFSTGLCSVGAVEENAGLRPDEVREPAADGLRGADPPAGPWLTGLGFAALVVVPLLGLAAWWRRRTGK